MWNQKNVGRFSDFAAEQRKYIQKILRDVSRETPLLMEHPLVTANILVYLPKLIVSRGWDLKNEVDDRTTRETHWSRSCDAVWDSEWSLRVVPGADG